MDNNLQKTYDVLDKIDILFYIDNKALNFRVIDLMDNLNMYVYFSSFKDILYDDYFSGELFNMMSEDEFIEYLQSRYPNKLNFNEVITTYVSKR